MAPNSLITGAALCSAMRPDESGWASTGRSRSMRMTGSTGIPLPTDCPMAGYGRFRATMGVAFGLAQKAG